MTNARGISRRKRDEVRSNDTLKNYSTSKLTPPISSSNGWRSLYHSAPRKRTYYRRLVDASLAHARGSWAGDGQPFRNPVRQGLPTIQELSRGGSNRKTEYSRFF